MRTVETLDLRGKANYGIPYHSWFYAHLKTSIVMFQFLLWLLKSYKSTKRKGDPGGFWRVLDKMVFWRLLRNEICHKEIEIYNVKRLKPNRKEAASIFFYLSQWKY